MLDSYSRQSQLAVSCFIHCNDSYLFQKRPETKVIDPGKLNIVGGRVEKGETFVDACVREIVEETGYKVSAEQITNLGFLEMAVEDYDDWHIGLFSVGVESQKIPVGEITDDGDYIWIPKEDVVSYKDKMVPDIPYYFEDVLNNNFPLFVSVQLDSSGKLITIKKSVLKA